MTSRTGLPAVELQMLRAVRDSPLAPEIPLEPAPDAEEPVTAAREEFATGGPATQDPPTRGSDDPGGDRGEPAEPTPPGGPDRVVSWQPDPAEPLPETGGWLRITSVSYEVVQVASPEPSDTVWHRDQAVLARFEEPTGIGPRYSYPMLCDLVQPWRTVLPLLTGQGNYGSQSGDPPSDVRYPWCGLSAVGAAALAAEDGSGPPLPLGLVNGSWYRGGVQPAFEPAAVAAAVLAAADGDPAAGAALLGSPADAAGCTVTGAIDRLLAGDAVRLTISSSVRRERGPRSDLLVVVGLVPGSTPASLFDDIIGRSARLLRRYPGGGPPIEERLKYALFVTDVRDESRSSIGCRVVLELEPEADPEATLTQLNGFWWFRQQIDARLPAPAEQLLADWVAEHGAERAAAGARVLAGLPVPTRRWG